MCPAEGVRFPLLWFIYLFSQEALLTSNRNIQYKGGWMVALMKYSFKQATITPLYMFKYIDFTAEIQLTKKEQRFHYYLYCNPAVYQWILLAPLDKSGSAYLLTVGQELTALCEAALAALRVWLPLSSLYVHVKEDTATVHGNLRLGLSRNRSIHLVHD